MSIIWTHIQFAEDVVDSIQNTDIFSQYEQYMKLGTQITNLKEFLYVHHKNNDKISFHHRDEYHLPLEIIKKAKNKDKHVQAFVFGVITHYILEQKIRPYIEYVNNQTFSEDINVEAQIDTLIMKKTYNLKTWKTPVYNEINIGLFIDKNIVNLLNEINHPISKHIQKTYWHLNVALRYYFDPYGWKTKLLPSFYPIYTPYSRAQNGIDYLNEEHNQWFNEQTGEISTYDFFQLYDRAKVDATVILNEVVKYWNNEHYRFNDEIKALLYSTYEKFISKQSS